MKKYSFTKLYLTSLADREMKRLRLRKARVLKLLSLHTLGYSMAEIGRRHRLSRERVRQELDWFKSTFE